MLFIIAIRLSNRFVLLENLKSNSQVTMTIQRLLSSGTIEHFESLIVSSLEIRLLKNPLSNSQVVKRVQRRSCAGIFSEQVCMKVLCVAKE